MAVERWLLAQPGGEGVLVPAMTTLVVFFFADALEVDELAGGMSGTENTSLITNAAPEGPARSGHGRRPS